MAKGQKRSNREIKKPKKAKAALAKPESNFANQLKIAENAKGRRGGSKN